MDINDNKNEEIKQEKEDNKFAYKTIFKKNKNSRIWSAASVFAGVLSVIFCFLPVLGIIFAFFAVALSVISRRTLDYFDGLAVTGLVIGIFGAVFGAVYSVFQTFFSGISFFG